MIHIISFLLLVGVKLMALRSIKYFRYDLNQIPYDFTVEVTNRFKGLDLIDRVPEELWQRFVTCTGGSDQDHPQEKEMQKGKMVV